MTPRWKREVETETKVGESRVGQCVTSNQIVQQVEGYLTISWKVLKACDMLQIIKPVAPDQSKLLFSLLCFTIM